MAMDYRASKPVWSRIKTKKALESPTPRWQVCIRARYQDGMDEEGAPIIKVKRVTKSFTGEYDTERKRNAATNKWISELEEADRQAAVTQAQLEAERAAAEERAKLEALAASQPTVGEYMDEFITMLETSQNVERVTVHNYRRTSKRIKTSLGSVKLASLTPRMVQRWEASMLEEGLAPSTVLKHHRLLSEVCKHAVDLDLIVKNPVNAVKPPKQVMASPNSLTVEQFARLAVTLEALEPSPVVTAAALALFTGMRQGEVCGLRWRAYDPAKRTIEVVESIGNAGGNTYSKTPKTRASKRTIPVPNRLFAILERRRREMVAELQEAGLAYTNEEFGRLYITGTVGGKYQNPTVLGREWRALSKSFGLVGTQGHAITYHDLRHSFATVGIAAGADVKSVAANLGHSNAALTLNVYADADPESKRRASNLIERTVTDAGEVEPFAQLAEAD